jgi:hypothetical protein
MKPRHYLDDMGGTLAGNERLRRIAIAGGFETFTGQTQIVAGYFLTQIDGLQGQLDALKEQVAALKADLATRPQPILRKAA